MKCSEGWIFFNVEDVVQQTLISWKQKVIWCALNVEQFGWAIVFLLLVILIWKGQNLYAIQRGESSILTK